VAVNAVLAVQLSRAREALRPSPFLSGDTAPVLEIRSVAGSERLRFNKERLPVILYWFSPTCSWCELNLANFRALAHQAPGRYRLVPVSAADPPALAEYARERDLDGPLFTISPEAARQYRLAGTPDTVLIAPDGAFVRRWSGAYSPNMLDEIETLLRVKLPGLPEPAGHGAATR
jgi:hypothetical protein